MSHQIGSPTTDRNVAATSIEINQEERKIKKTTKPLPPDTLKQASVDEWKEKLNVHDESNFSDISEGQESYLSTEEASRSRSNSTGSDHENVLADTTQTNISTAGDEQVDVKQDVVKTTIITTRQPVIVETEERIVSESESTRSFTKPASLSQSTSSLPKKSLQGAIVGPRGDVLRRGEKNEDTRPQNILSQSTANLSAKKTSAQNTEVRNVAFSTASASGRSVADLAHIFDEPTSSGDLLDQEIKGTKKLQTPLQAEHIPVSGLVHEEPAVLTSLDGSQMPTAQQDRANPLNTAQESTLAQFEDSLRQSADAPLNHRQNQEIPLEIPQPFSTNLQAPEPLQDHSIHRLSLKEAKKALEKRERRDRIKYRVFWVLSFFGVVTLATSLVSALFYRRRIQVFTTKEIPSFVKRSLQWLKSLFVRTPKA